MDADSVMDPPGRLRRAPAPHKGGAMSNTTAAPAWLENAAKADADAPADRVPIAPGAPTKPKPRPGVADGDLAVVAEPRAPKPTDEGVLVRTGYHGRTLLPSTI